MSRIAHEMKREMMVAPRPMRRFVRSLMAPMICGENRIAEGVNAERD